MNKIIITGRATKDIEQKQTTSGTSVATFSVAVKRSFKSNGEQESDFFDCVAYSKTAELISKYVKKGDMIGIEGRLQTRNYTNREGRKIYITEIIAESVEFLQTKKQDATDTRFEETDPFKDAKFEEIKADDDLPF